MNAPLLETIYHEIDTQGPLSFAGYMDLALYAPNLGYYSNPLRKFGKEGDFVTAPEISPLFARCLAKQIQQIFLSIPSSDLLEFGAGSGQMALDLLLELEKQDSLPQHYYILELSRQLRERQQALLSEKLPQFIHRVQWLDRLPEPGFNGVMIANEVLDAMPVHKFKLHASKNKDFDSVRELYVTHKNKQLRWQEGVPSSPLLIEKLQPIIQTLNSYQEAGYVLPMDYESEINLLLPAWLKALDQCTHQAVILLLDYGFPRQEYYHPERSMGTLMCHHRHKAHSDPLVLTGLQDITAHVDFSFLADAAFAAGFHVAGYTDQAHFLFNCGLMDRLDSNETYTADTFAINQQIKILTLPSEMGELVKVIALNKNTDGVLLGFKQGDKRIKLASESNPTIFS